MWSSSRLQAYAASPPSTHLYTHTHTRTHVLKIFFAIATSLLLSLFVLLSPPDFFSSSPTAFSLAQVALYQSYRPGSTWAKESVTVPLSVLMKVPSLSDLQKAQGEGQALVMTTRRRYDSDPCDSEKSNPNTTLVQYTAVPWSTTTSRPQVEVPAHSVP